MTDKSHDAWSRVAEELEGGLIEMDQGAAEMVAAGHAQQALAALVASRDQLLGMATLPEYHAMVRRVFDRRIAALEEAAE